MAPKMKGLFSNNQQLAGMDFRVGIGVDVGTVLVVRGGIRGEDNSDLVWVGNATNIAVKLSELCSRRRLPDVGAA
jgi:class 3 adenylate cyclase